MTELTIEEAGALAPPLTAVDGEARVVAGALLIDVAQLITWEYTDVVHIEGGFPTWKEAGFATGAPAAEKGSPAALGSAR